jgi:hypothetical protein
MRSTNRYFYLLLLAAALIAPALFGGCSTPAGSRVYDPYNNDYHRWDDHETKYYLQWEGENHREHRDFDKRSEDERKDYWTWRHSHPDADRDRH